MDWDTAQEWIAAMNAANYLGVSNWRLPTADVNANGQVIQCSFGSQNEPLCRDNELSYHYHQNQIDAARPSPFTNIATYVGVGYYGSGTEYALDPSRRWIVNFGFELQGLNPKSAHTLIWPVSPGDQLPVNAVPVPIAAWLFSGAIGALVWARRKQFNTN